MSRIGNQPVQIPSGVTVEKTDNYLVVNGPKGKLDLKLLPEIKVEVDGDRISVTRNSEDKRVKSLHGLIRNLINNMIIGVSSGWSKKLELVGVGFRAQSSGDKLVLSVGYSHPVEIMAPLGIQFEVRDNTKIQVSGIDKYLVGQTAANIKKVRPPDAYKGKGIRYEGELVRKKPGKSGKVGAM